MTTCTDEARCQDFPLCRCARRGFSLDDGDTGASFWPPLCPPVPQSDPPVGPDKGGDDSGPQTGAQRFHPGGMTGAGIVMVPAGTVFTHSPAVALERERNDLRAEVARLLAEIDDRESERADLRDRVTKAEPALERVEALHRRRPWDFLKDSVTFGQSQYPDRCDHCRVAWPCDTTKGES